MSRPLQSLISRASSYVISLAIFGAILGAISLAHLTAQAEELPISDQRTSSLSWVRLPNAESCIGTKQLAKAVEARLRRRAIVSAAEGDLSIEGRVEQRVDPAGWRATVVVSNAAGMVLGERTLDIDGVECLVLDEALVMVIAVMIDPDAALEPEASEPHNDPPEPALVSQEDPPPNPQPEVRNIDAPEQSGNDNDPSLTQDQIEEESPLSFRVDLAEDMLLGVGFLPGVPLGPSLITVLDPPHFWPITLEVGGYFNSNLEEPSGASAKFAQAFGGLAVCAPWEPNSLRLHGCLGIHAGAIHVAGGEGFDRAFDHWRGAVNGFARVRILWNVWRILVIHFGASLLIPFIRDSFVYEDGRGQIQTLYEAWPVSLSFSIGLGFIIEGSTDHSSL